MQLGLVLNPEDEVGGLVVGHDGGLLEDVAKTLHGKWLAALSVGERDDGRIQRNKRICLDDLPPIVEQVVEGIGKYLRILHIFFRESVFC